MKLDQLVIKTAIVQVLLMITKIIFFKYLNLEFLPILILYYVVLAAVCIAIVRRLGALNYFEAILLTIIWLVLNILLDLLITQAIINKGVFGNGHFWISYLVMPIVLFIFHKKVHVEARKASK